MDPQSETGAYSRFAWLQQHAGALVVALFVIASLIAGGVLLLKQAPNSSKTLQVNGKQFSLQVASTSQSQAIGLANRTSLPANQGLLFVYKSSQRACMWMNGVEFPLDIIWLDGNKKVVYIQPNATPNTLPDTFCPTVEARYVIELNAGSVASAGIRTGQTLSF